MKLTHIAALGAATVVLLPHVGRADDPPQRAAVAPMPLTASIERGTKPASSPELLERGTKAFAVSCAVCHGPTGRGDGPLAFLSEPPHDFGKGIFELHSNESGSLPTDEDLFDTVTRGMPGSAMPGFASLSTDDRWALVEAVKSFAVFKDPDEGTEIHFFRDRPPSAPLALGTPPAASAEVIARGRALFAKLECTKCHGERGDGAGPASVGLKTAFGEPDFPRDFRDSRFVGGASIRDLALRITTGLDGTPMASFKTTTDDERFALAHFVASLRRGEPIAEKRASIAAAKNGEPIPSDLLQPRLWADVPRVELALEGGGVKSARVSVQRDAKRIAVLVAWDHAIAADRAPSAEELLAARATIGLAKSANEWRAEWQRDFAKRKTGAFDEKSAGVEGVGCWEDGAWRVLFVRPIAGLEGQTVKLTLTIEDGARASSQPIEVVIP